MANKLAQPTNAGGGSTDIPTTTVAIPFTRTIKLAVPGSTSGTGGPTVITQGQGYPRKT